MKNKVLSIVLIGLCAMTLSLMLPDLIMGEDEPTPAKEETPVTEKYVGKGNGELGNGEKIVGTEGITVRTDGKDMGIADYITKMMEYAYHEGQKDFMDGDVRIDSSYKWIKSPWDGKDTSKVLYKP